MDRNRLLPTFESNNVVAIMTVSNSAHSCLPLSKINSEQWKTFTRRRWPLFRPIAAVRDWFATYSALVESWEAMKQKFCFSFGLKNGLRFHFDSVKCLN